MLPAISVDDSTCPLPTRAVSLHPSGASSIRVKREERRRRLRPWPGQWAARGSTRRAARSRSQAPCPTATPGGGAGADPPGAAGSRKRDSCAFLSTNASCTHPLTLARNHP
eukprot:2051593-Rhodomonas_salina.1